jgi:hypothetical protein
MRTRLITMAVAFLALSPSARAEDCTRRPKQAEQIECLQRTVEMLQRQLERLLPKRQSTVAGRATGNEVEVYSIEALIDEKIREAIKPRVHLLPK